MHLECLPSDNVHDDYFKSYLPYSHPIRNHFHHATEIFQIFRRFYFWNSRNSKRKFNFWQRSKMYGHDRTGPNRYGGPRFWSKIYLDRMLVRKLVPEVCSFRAGPYFFVKRFFGPDEMPQRRSVVKSVLIWIWVGFGLGPNSRIPFWFLEKRSKRPIENKDLSITR